MEQIAVQLPTGALAQFCQRWQIAELSLFGSVTRSDFRPDSDVDELVAFEPGARVRPFDMVDMQEDLSRLLGRKADLVDRRAVERSGNYIRRRHILDSAVKVYDATGG